MPTRSPITFIHHHHAAAELNNNAATHLSRLGFDIQHRFPFDNDKLIVPASGVTPTIILGGGQNVTELHKHKYLSDELRWIDACLENNVPILGLCLGAQLMAHALGANVSGPQPPKCEFGFYEVTPTDHAGDWLETPRYFMQAHYQEFSLPKDAVHLAYSENFSQQAFKYGDSAYGIQFHPEVNQEIFEAWLSDNWTDEMLQIPGAQTKEQQIQFSNIYLKEQNTWLEKTVGNLFLHNRVRLHHSKCY